MNKMPSCNLIVFCLFLHEAINSKREAPELVQIQQKNIFFLAITILMHFALHRCCSLAFIRERHFLAQSYFPSKIIGVCSSSANLASVFRSIFNCRLSRFKIALSLTWNPSNPVQLNPLSETSIYFSIFKLLSF